jgi:hypothetical protein
LGPTPEFTVGIAGGGQRNLGEEEGVRVYGQFNRHRIVTVTPRQIPNHTLLLQNLTQEAISLQGAIYCSFDFLGHLSLLGDQPAYKGGEPLKLELGLKNRQSDLFVSDPWILDHLVAIVRLTDASGESVEKRFPFGKDGRSPQTREILLDPRTPAGTFMIATSYALVTGDGFPLLSVTPVEVQTEVLRSAPTIQLEFLTQRIFKGHSVPLRGEIISGHPPANTVKVTLDHVPASGEEKQSLELEIAWNAEEKAYMGSTLMERAGQYRILEEENEATKIVPGLRGSLQVGNREIAILTESGAPLENVVFGPDPAEGKGFQPITFIVNAELLPGEKGGLTLIAHPHHSEAGVNLVVEEGKSLDLTGEQPRGKVTVRLEAPKGTDPRGALGTIEIQGTLGGDAIRWETPVSAALRPVEEETWSQFMQRREVLLAGIAVATLILLGLLLLLTIPKYHEEHLLHERGDGGWDDGVLLSEMQKGASPRNAFGTPEIKNALWFQLKGRKGLGHSQVLVKPVKPFIQFFRNNKLQKDWVQLEHGDRIRLRGARYEHFYRFLEHSLTPEEYAALQPESPTAPPPEAEVEAAEEEEEVSPQAELIIEIPTEPEEAIPETAISGIPETMPEEYGEEEEEEEEVEEEYEEAPSPLSELETIFGSGPAAPTKEEAPPEMEPEKALSFTDIFGEEEEAPRAAGEMEEEAYGEEVEEEEEAEPEGPEFDDQDTIFEQFFGGEKTAPPEEEPKEGTDILPEPMEEGDGTEIVDEEKAVPVEAPEGGTDIIPETVVAGDGTEIVDEGVLAEAFKVEPAAGGFTDEDITKLLEESGIEDGDSLVIDMPVDSEDAQAGEGEDVFTVGGEVDAAASEEEDDEVSPELMETQEVEMDRAAEDRTLFEVAEDGSPVEAAGAEEGEELPLEDEEEVEVEMETVLEPEEGGPGEELEGEMEEEEELEAELMETVEEDADGILTSIFSSEKKEKEGEEEAGEEDRETVETFEDFSEIRTEIETEGEAEVETEIVAEEEPEVQTEIVAEEEPEAEEEDEAEAEGEEGREAGNPGAEAEASGPIVVTPPDEYFRLKKKKEGDD